ncbi:B12-binding domain-containing radical SAM protein [Candidatus Bathyarchaeota archaeon]|nr:MAG: B12-binding domain-containing radical SAM protein [Candidatus Bathyarchaeota archaeon]
MGHRLKITLIKPPEQSSLNFGCFSLAVLASAIEDIANVRLIDATNLNPAKAVQTILSSSPDILGLTAMSVSSVEPASILIELLRKNGFHGRLLVGGHGASVLPMPLLERGADAVVYGEGEQTLREAILQGIYVKTAGLLMMRDGKIIKTSPRRLIDLDTLVMPAKKWIITPKDRLYFLETSRGCPHKCRFCETSSFFRCTWRSRSPEKVVKDIENLVDRGALIIQITDDNFTANPKRAIKICNELENRNLPLFFVFSARSDDLLSDPELIPSLAKANFLRAAIGVETPDEKMSRQIGKGISLKQHKLAFDGLRKAGIYTVASFIVGLPEETEQIRQNYVEIACELADSATFVPFLPLPGTEMDDGSVTPQVWSVECAAKLTREFRQNPKNIERLLQAAKEPSIRGILARRSLQKRIAENILDNKL